MIWLYWNLRAYRYDLVLQKIVTSTFWDGVKSTQREGPSMRKEDLQ